MKYLAGLEVTEGQFAKLRALCPKDHEFPANWVQWELLAAKASEEARREGLAASAMTLDLDHFEAWCRMVGIVPCLDALRAYAIVMRTIMDDRKN